ncbi:DUF695 domain-containing protein [Botrimarina mediterranea]|uniref:DUF695 domain-containing protein n=1 Tax=Botrimarina mediterranea TaxID=2528022 RepID=A0A518K4C0_9BACT|nr:DUF695 domain-containing protein [Botrimarina mediterranea]QDV72630.1 hypothetical protein Spa11_08110 [Botrimarina mediterranea]QDV77202.1 hypothetical protein K2D_07920 [Planctomycetes bacterium K2D]
MSDHWEIYLCQVEDKPASILFDVGIRQQAPVPALDWVGWLRLHMRDPRPDGLSSNSEYDRLIEIEESVSTAVNQARCSIAYVGRNTGNAKRDFFFYSDNQICLESLLAQAMVGYPEYQFEVGGREDAEWDIYLGFLYPDSRTWQVISDRKLTDRLAQDGDNGTIPRDVSHWAYFKTVESRTKFIEQFTSDGFSVEQQFSSDESELQHCVVLTRNHAVDPDNIHTISLRMHDTAADLGGSYDGWETPIVKQTP